MEAIDESGSSGTLQRDRISVSRTRVLADADALFAVHAAGPSARASLGVIFADAKGSGDGVTREFYGSLAAAFADADSGCAWRRTSADASLVPALGAPVGRFRTLGRALGKALQDGFLVPLPLDPSFFAAIQDRLIESRVRVDDAGLAVRAVLDDAELRRTAATVAPELTNIFAAARMLAGPRAGGGNAVPTASPVDAFGLDFEHPETLEDLSAVELLSGVTARAAAAALGAGDITRLTPVTNANVHVFGAALLVYVTREGCRAAVDATSAGLADVLAAPRALLLLSPVELRDAVCGAPRVEWNAASLRASVSCGGGYVAESSPVRDFFAVLEEFDQGERAEFLRFATGCASLPPGGLAGLTPMLNILKKTDVSIRPRAATDGPIEIFSDDDAEMGGGATRSGGGAATPGALYDTSLVSSSTCASNRQSADVTHLAQSKSSC